MNMVTANIYTGSNPEPTGCYKCTIVSQTGHAIVLRDSEGNVLNGIVEDNIVKVFR